LLLLRKNDITIIAIYLIVVDVHCSSSNANIMHGLVTVADQFLKLNKSSYLYGESLKFDKNTTTTTLSHAGERKASYSYRFLDIIIIIIIIIIVIVIVHARKKQSTEGH
jgi:hypothetical protein